MNLEEFKKKKSALIRAYRLSLDPSLILDLLRNPARLERLDVLGEGADFKAYKLTSSDRIPLVLKVARQDFLEKKGLNQWKKALSLLKPFIASTLVPPFDLFESPLALVMPFGLKQQAGSGSQVSETDLDSFTEYTQLQLKSLRLEFKEGLDVLYALDCPFVFDLSDVSSINF